MTPLLYWALLVLLVVLLVVLSCYLILSFFWDFCIPEPLPLNPKMSRQRDVEDLTSIEGDFTAIRSDLSFRNEVEDDRIVRELLGRELQKQKSSGVSRSVDDLEFCDPDSIDVLKRISEVEERAREVEEEVNTYVGGTNDVKYYEINEKFIRLMITICEIYSEKDEVRRRKAEVYNYIEGCQKKLKEKRM